MSMIVLTAEVQEAQSVLNRPEAPGWRARRFNSALQTVCFIVMLGRNLSPCRGLAAQSASPTLGMRAARVGLTLVCRPGMGSLYALPGAGTPMRCGAVPSSAPLSLSPPAFSDEACSSSDSLADVLLQRFTQDVQLNQLPLRIPAELLDTESEPPAIFDLWEYLSQGSS